MRPRYPKRKTYTMILDMVADSHAAVFVVISRRFYSILTFRLYTRFRVLSTKRVKLELSRATGAVSPLLIGFSA